jgi:hypothetical protein
LLESTARWNGFRDKTMSKRNHDDFVDALTALAGGAEPQDLSRIETLASPAAEVPIASSPAADAQRRSLFSRADDRRLHARRTLIPILLTCGVLLIAIASLKWLAGPISIFAQLELWVAIVMIALGGALLAVAGLNMLQVRNHFLRNADRGG